MEVYQNLYFLIGIKSLRRKEREERETEMRKNEFMKFILITIRVKYRGLTPFI